MKRYLSALALVLGVLTTPTYAELIVDEQGCCAICVPDYSLDANVQIGYRFDELDWNIGISPLGPNILSELQWKDLNILQVGGEIVLEHQNSFYMRANGYYGWVRSGTVQDSDFLLNDRLLEFSRSVSKAKGSHVADVTVGVGKIYYRCDGAFSIAPMIGYSFHRQFLRIRDGQQIIPEPAPIPGLNSSYTTSWNTAWLGFDIGCDQLAPWIFLLSYEFHYANYQGTGHWNLRTDFRHDFRHHANGVGQVLRLRADYQVTSSFDITFETQLQGWFLYDGNARVFLNGPLDTPVSLGCDFNRVRWRSAAFMVGGNLSF